MTAPAYVQIPVATYDALDTGSLSPEQFDIFSYAYWRASRPEYRVRSYSAANVCRFRGLDATDANVKRYERAAADLLNRNLICRDYYRIDPSRSNKGTRTYSIWVPNPKSFDKIGTPEENLSIWPAVVGLLDPDIVGLPAGAMDSKQNTSEGTETDNVGLGIGQKWHQLSITNQENLKTEREIPLNPPRGTSSPLPLPGEYSDAVGLEKQGITRKILSASDCARLQESVLFFCEAVRTVYGLSPDAERARTLLRKYGPIEIFFALMATHEPWSYKNVKKTDFAYFFRKSAPQIIDVRRLQQISRTPSSEVQKLAATSKENHQMLLRNPNIKKSEDLWNESFHGGRKVDALKPLVDGQEPRHKLEWSGSPPHLG